MSNSVGLAFVCSLWRAMIFRNNASSEDNFPEVYALIPSVEN
ncbi:MAG: hypothetical protein U5Q03_00065 [Bacteroidota bacterium]|nr:hypothetical protein [Bacteroidota bacterium]